MDCIGDPDKCSAIGRSCVFQTSQSPDSFSPCGTTDHEDCFCLNPCKLPHTFLLSPENANGGSTDYDSLALKAILYPDIFRAGGKCRQNKFGQNICARI